jgi:hypothetical protein
MVTVKLGGLLEKPFFARDTHKEEMHRLIIIAVLVLSAGLQAAECFTAPTCAPLAQTRALSTPSGAPAVRRRLLLLCFAASWWGPLAQHRRRGLMGAKRVD